MNVRLPSDFQHGRLRNYNLALGGSLREVLSDFNDSSDVLESHLLEQAAPSHTKLALGILSVDLAKFYLLSAAHIKRPETPIAGLAAADLDATQPEALTAAFASAERAVTYFESQQEGSSAAEAISLKGLLHVAAGFSEPYGSRLVSKFKEARACIEQSRALQKSNGAPFASELIVNDLEERLHDWRGRRVTDEYFQRRIIDLLSATHDDIAQQLGIEGYR